MENLEITPKTKVGELLKTYPQLEELLIEIAPVFSKLKNPVLRNTIAKVTSLQQAAMVGGVSVAEMINKLRSAVGQTGLNLTEDNNESDDKPEWYDEKIISKTIDLRPLVNEGQHPIGLVFEELGKLEKGKIFIAIMPFFPAPMIDKTKEKGFKVYVIKLKEDEFRVCFFHG